MRRSLITMACAILAAAGACYFLFLYPPALKNNLKSILEQHLAADIDLGSASLRPLSGLTLEGLDVRRAPGSSAIFHAGRIRIRPRLSALLRFRLQIKEIGLENAAVVFRRDPAGTSNWAGVLKGSTAPREGKPPAFNLKNGRVTIGTYIFEGLNCELIPFPSEHTIAIRGSMDDHFWGSYRVSGSLDSNQETVRLSFESRDLTLTEDWVSEFPFVGQDIWTRYRPAGLFDLTGTITYSWGDSRANDFSLIFTAKDSSFHWLVFPVTGATARLFVDPQSAVINHLKGTMFKGAIEGYSIINLAAPCTYFNRYSFNEVDMTDFLKDFQAGAQSLGGRGSGYVSFQGDHCLDEFQGRGELLIPGARLWKFPIIIQILSQLRYPLWTGEEPLQDCTIKFSFSEEGFNLEEVSLVSNVLDICGEGWAAYDGSLKLTCYARPVSKTPIFLADLLIQPALDSLSGSLAQFEITGTLARPKITLIPLTPVSKKITNFFDALTRQRLGR